MLLLESMPADSINRDLERDGMVGGLLSWSGGV